MTTDKYTWEDLETYLNLPTVSEDTVKISVCTHEVGSTPVKGYWICKKCGINLEACK